MCVHAGAMHPATNTMNSILTTVSRYAIFGASIGTIVAAAVITQG